MTVPFASWSGRPLRKAEKFLHFHTTNMPVIRVTKPFCVSTLRWLPVRPLYQRDRDSFMDSPASGTRKQFRGEKMTGFVPVMWSVWGLLIVLLAVVNLYASRLARDEEDQIFLGEGFTQERSAQAEIMAKIAKVEPVKRLVLWALGAMTVFVLGYYVLDIVRQFR